MWPRSERSWSSADRLAFCDDLKDEISDRTEESKEARCSASRRDAWGQRRDQKGSVHRPRRGETHFGSFEIAFVVGQDLTMPGRSVVHGRRWGWIRLRLK